MIHAFRALRPSAAVVAEVVCPPYDVIDTREARALAEGKPKSFLRVIRPEVELGADVDEHADAVYAQGARNLAGCRVSADFAFDAEPSLYVYRLVMGGRSQTGIFACVAVDDYDAGRIVRHELTRPDKEDDRTRHILEQGAHAEPVMLAYRDVPAVDAAVAAIVATEPLLQVQVGDVAHTVWKATDPEGLKAAFGAVDRLYVADGHHRCKASSRAAHALRGTDAWTPDAEVFPAVVFPMGQMMIMPYNRVIRRVPGGVDAFLAALSGVVGPLTPVTSGTPTVAGQAVLYAGAARGWQAFSLPATQRPGASDALDVARLAEWVLGPLLGIADARTSQNIGFVGGIRGTAELQRVVDGGEAELAFSMYPTSMHELLAVSDASELMPPKSTWFEPKLLSGLLIHCFSSALTAP